jgi:hypothetical protein
MRRTSIGSDEDGDNHGNAVAVNPTNQMYDRQGQPSACQDGVIRTRAAVD